MQLKKPDKDTGEYDLNVCSVVKCNNPSEVIYDTKKLAKVKYAFCEKHHKEKCREEENESGIVFHDRRRSKVLDPKREQKGEDG
jgi:hypothetical protein